MVDGIVRVSEADIAAAMAALLFRTKLVAEPAGAVAAAAFFRGVVGEGKKTVALVSGGNLSPEMLAATAQTSVR